MRRVITYQAARTVSEKQGKTDIAHIVEIFLKIMQNPIDFRRNIVYYLDIGDITPIHTTETEGDQMHYNLSHETVIIEPGAENIDNFLSVSLFHQNNHSTDSGATVPQVLAACAVVLIAWIAGGLLAMI